MIVGTWPGAATETQRLNEAKAIRTVRIGRSPKKVCMEESNLSFRATRGMTDKRFPTWQPGKLPQSMRDRQSLAALYDRHAARLYAIALRITNDRDAAADALEAAFVALSRNDDAGDPATYLIQAVRECALARKTRPASA